MNNQTTDELLLDWQERVGAARQECDPQSLLDMIPYAAFIGAQAKVDDQRLLYWLDKRASNIGNPSLPAIHGGVIGGFLELAAAIEIIYSEFKNAATQEFKAEPFLPIPKMAKKANEKKTDFIFEPQKEILVAELMPKILNTQLFKAVLDANASEHGARMTAMDKASENANELLKSLKISYNRARQAAITTELTEIVSGAAALNG